MTGAVIALALVGLAGLSGRYFAEPATRLFAPLDYSRDVERWWATHPFNPESPSYIPIGALPPPDGPTLNVRQEYAGNIQAAIDALPASGGSLYFEPGVYPGSFAVIGRSNVHFLADGAVTFTGQARVYGCALAQDYGTITRAVYDRVPEALACVTTDRARNIYFKNIRFDGGDTLTSGFWVAAAQAVVLDNVTFERFHDPGWPLAALAGGHVVVDDIWFRGVRFLGNSRYAVYLDGCHSCGVLESEIAPRFGSGGLLYLTNDDLSGDYNRDGAWQGQEIRLSRYIVVAHNRFGDDSSDGFYELIALRSSDTLIKANTLGAYSYRFVNLAGNCDGTNPNVDMRYYNVRVVGNRIAGVDHLIHVDGSPGHCGVLPGTTMRIGRYTVRDNVVDHLGEHGLVWETWETESAIDGPNRAERNCIAGRLDGTDRPCP